MRVFVTGGTGFVGKHTLRRLVEGSHKVRCLVKRTSQTSELEKLGCEFAVGDVTDKESVLEGMRGCEWVVHLAKRRQEEDRQRQGAASGAGLLVGGGVRWRRGGGSHPYTLLTTSAAQRCAEKMALLKQPRVR